MLLDGVLTAAASGLSSVTSQLATISQNVANANTPGYSRETLPIDTVTAGGVGMGVRSGVATRSVDTALQADLFATGAQVAGSQVRQNALAAIDQASGTPGAGQDLATLVGALRDSFSALQNDPANQTQQRDVVNKASQLASGINAIGQAITTTRQSVQDTMVTDITQANAALQTVGQLSDQIVAARNRGESTAGLEDQRDAAEQTATSLTGASFLPQSNGDVLAISGGLVLPTRTTTGPFALAPATLEPDTPAAAVPSLTVAGSPVTLTGGKIGAELNLRDTVLPAAQATVDNFAQSLATSFDSAGLTLFTNPAGVIPAAATPGFSLSIQAAPAIQTTPSIVRDGAAATTTAGNTTLIDTILNTVLATGSGTIAGQASNLVANNAAAAAAATTQLTTQQTLQTSLSTKLTAGSGVSVDSELSSMVSLQNSYSANAKVINAVQTMFTQLMAVLQ